MEQPSACSAFQQFKWLLETLNISEISETLISLFYEHIIICFGESGETFSSQTVTISKNFLGEITVSYLKVRLSLTTYATACPVYAVKSGGLATLNDP